MIQAFGGVGFLNSSDSQRVLGTVISGYIPKSWWGFVVEKQYYLLYRYFGP